MTSSSSQNWLTTGSSTQLLFKLGLFVTLFVPDPVPSDEGFSVLTIGFLVAIFHFCTFGKNLLSVFSDFKPATSGFAVLDLKFAKTRRLDSFFTSLS